jgi:hypothetical protein
MRLRYVAMMRSLLVLVRDVGEKDTHQPPAVAFVIDAS